MLSMNVSACDGRGLASSLNVHTNHGCHLKMESMALWEQLLLGVGGLALVFFLWPGIKQTMEQSREAEKDWSGLLIPIGCVVLFVMALIALA